MERPIEKILENEQKLYKTLDPQIINSNLLYKSNLLFHFSIYHGLFGSKTQEIILNEDQNLSELADNIYCLVKEFRCIYKYINLNNHYYLAQDQNDNISNSSFFFIENVFYNDMRKIESKMLSKSIVFKQKRTENEEKVKIFEENLMETQKIKDLSLRIGKIYLYRHHESCDHMIVVNSIR